VEPEAPSQGAAFETCYRHPSEQTGVHCTRCNRPICPECMIPAPVGFQCPECVADARKAFRQGPARRIRAATVRQTSATLATLLLLAAIFVVQLASGHGVGLGLTGQIDPLLRHGAVIPIAVADGQYYRLVTAMFLHFSVLHLLMNAWALWFFGQFIETSYGRWGFVVIFLVGGFCGSVATYLFGPVVEVSAGASGAIFALFGAFIAYNVRRRHSAMSRANLQSAVFLILLNLFLTLGYSQIDWRAHLGGIVGGFAVGGVIDWAGSRQSRRGTAIAGVVGILAIGVGMVVVRTAQLQAQFPGFLNELTRRLFS
jgi:membrane associated rhomboid family serine protease